MWYYVYWDVILCDKIYLCFSNMMMGHVIIGGCKSKDLQQVLKEFNNNNNNKPLIELSWFNYEMQFFQKKKIVEIHWFNSNKFKKHMQ